MRVIMDAEACSPLNALEEGPALASTRFFLLSGMQFEALWKIVASPS